MTVLFSALSFRDEIRHEAKIFTSSCYFIVYFNYIIYKIYNIIYIDSIAWSYFLVRCRIDMIFSPSCRIWFVYSPSSKSDTVICHNCHSCHLSRCLPPSKPPILLSLRLQNRGAVYNYI